MLQLRGEASAPPEKRRCTFPFSGALGLRPRFPACPEDRPPPSLRSLQSGAQSRDGQRGGAGRGGAGPGGEVGGVSPEERAGLVTRAPQGRPMGSGAQGGDLRREPHLSLSCAPLASLSTSLNLSFLIRHKNGDT